MSEHRPRIKSETWKKIKILAAYNGVSTETEINNALEYYANVKKEGNINRKGIQRGNGTLPRT